MNRREAIAALVALPEVSRIQVARPEADDVIVVESEHELTPKGVENIKTTLGRIWPERRIVVFPKGFRMKLVKA